MQKEYTFIWETEACKYTQWLKKRKKEKKKSELNRHIQYTDDSIQVEYVWNINP